MVMYPETMTTPKFSAISARSNTGGYGVEVRECVAPGWQGVRWAGPLEGEPFDIPAVWAKLTGGTVTPDGSLYIEPEVWRARHYRRAVMHGAGVYQVSLWAHLAGKRQAMPIEVGQRTALRGNGGQILDRFTRVGYAPPPPPPEVLARITFRQIQRIYGPAVAMKVMHQGMSIAGLLGQVYRDAQAKAVSQVVAQVAEATSPRHIVRQVLAVLHECGHQIPSIRDGSAGFLYAAAHKVAAQVFQSGREHRAQRRAYWAAIRDVVGVLRRMVPRRIRPQRAPSRAPRPLYSRAIPPAAPLAPPVL